MPVNPPNDVAAAESRLVWEFFGRAAEGVFVDVGANDPIVENQTWLLEQQGWSGVLVEANPELAERLRAARPRSQTFQVAVGAPGAPAEVELCIGESDFHSAVDPTGDNAMSGRKVRVPLRTLDAILTDAGVKRVDFLSVDVEGMEMAVLQGLDLKRFAPRLILLEEHRRDYEKHFYLKRHGYRLVKRTGFNNWYVPADSPATVGSLNTLVERLQLFKKMWLNPPCNNFYRWLRGLGGAGKMRGR